MRSSTSKPGPFGKPRGTLRRPEAVLLFSAAAACVLLTLFLPERSPRGGGPDDLPSDRYREGGLFARRSGPYPEIRLTVEPEFLRALDAGRPKFDGCSRRVRLKSVPVERVEVDGRRIPGRFEIRYRGFCGLHWNGLQKSLKLKGARGAEIRGYRSVNLNTLNADGVFFDNWGALVNHAAGGLGPSAGFARVFINGKDDGLHQLIENMDRDFLAQHFLAKGAVYRERNHVILGRRPWDARRLKVLWKKNALGNASWEDLRSFNAAVYSSVAGEGDGYLEHLDVPRYVNYQAVTTLTGTMHFDSHNIPFYRPRRSSKFVPLAYDFGDSGQGRPGGVFSAAQVPYAALNLPARLFWSNRELRLRIHRRIAALLERHPGMEDWYVNLAAEVKGEVLRDIRAGLVLEVLGEPEERAAAYEARLEETRRIIENRIAHFRRAYLDPLVRATPGWRELSSFQLAVEGAGLYAARFSGGGTPCSPGDGLRVRVNKGEWEEVVRCEGRRLVSREFEAEENAILRPDDPDGPVSWKNPIGAILVDVERRGAPAAAGLEVRSLQTGREVEVRDDWAFSIGDAAVGRVSIGKPLLGYEEDLEKKPGYKFINLGAGVQPKSRYEYDSKSGGVLFIDGAVAGPEQPGRFGPILCWNQGGRKFCREFDARWSAAPAPKTSAELPAWEMRFVDPAEFAACERFDFKPGKWYVGEPVESAKGCRVDFHPGAEILFASDAYMVLRGPAVFPKEGKGAIVAFKAFSGDWGGLVLEKPGEDCRVHRAHFTQANEFMRGGVRYTAALTILEPENCIVQENLFIDNYGDDALNIRGGRAFVLRNLFYGNRDAMDFDRGTVEVRRNVVVNSADDGIDLGERAQAALSENLVYGSGDKAVSVGEGAAALIEKTILKANNIGVGVKENSRAVLDGVLLEGNELALTGYRTPEALPGDAGARIEGFPVFHRNVLDLKLDGVRRAPGAVPGLRPKTYSDGTGLAVLHAVGAGCSICGQKLWVNAPGDAAAGRELVMPLEFFKPGQARRRP